ncbi:MAG: hypothetical protein ACE37H_07165 [Phycisphaeraceae bacterium]
MRPIARLALTSFVLLIVPVSIGCQTHRAADRTFVSANALERAYVSHMALSVELTDPATGLPEHPSADELRPAVLREVERLTFALLLRAVVNQPAVQATRWFAPFDNDLDDAHSALYKVIGVQNIEGSPIIYVHATTAHRDDAQIILTALHDEYMRQHEMARQSAEQRALQAAQKRLDAAEQHATSVNASLKRLLSVKQQAGPDEQEAIDFQFETLERKLIHAEETVALVRSRIADLIERQHNGGGLLGYRIVVEYPPQKAVREDID